MLFAEAIWASGRTPCRKAGHMIAFEPTLISARSDLNPPGRPHMEKPRSVGNFVCVGPQNT
jgi:hypothetical protein